MLYAMAHFFMRFARHGLALRSTRPCDFLLILDDFTQPTLANGSVEPVFCSTLEHFEYACRAEL